MTATTKIEWADSTFNPWEGFTKIGPGCDHCYAENRNARFGGGTSPNWGAGAPRRRTSASNWQQPIKWNAAGSVCVDCAQPASGGDCPCGQVGAVGEVRRRRVFCASLADVFDNEAPIEWRAHLFDLIRKTPDLDWLLLTKRIGNVEKSIDYVMGWLAQDEMRDLAIWCHEWRHGKPPANVWLGATVVNQSEADRDVLKLLRVPAAVRFLSMEPLLGPVDLTSVQRFPDSSEYIDALLGTCWTDQKGLPNPDPAWAKPGMPFSGAPARVDWVIAGGESGPNARASHPDWFRALRDQCAKANVPFLFKQWGEWLPWNQFNESAVVDFGESTRFQTREFVEGDWIDVGKPGVWETFDGEVDDSNCAGRVGKRLAGRVLDGIEHNGFPAQRP